MNKNYFYKRNKSFGKSPKRLKNSLEIEMLLSKYAIGGEDIKT